MTIGLIVCALAIIFGLVLFFTSNQDFKSNLMAFLVIALGLLFLAHSISWQQRNDDIDALKQKFVDMHCDLVEFKENRASTLKCPNGITAYMILTKDDISLFNRDH